MTKKIARPPEAQTFADAEPIVVRRIVSETVRRGLDAPSLCRGLGFDVADLESPDLRISYAQVSRVIRRALPLLGDPQLALRLGASANLVSWGFCFVGLMASARSQAVLEFAIDFLPSTGRLLRIHGKDDGWQFSLVADSLYDEPDVYSFLVDVTFASLMQMCHQVVGKTYGPVSVEFTAARPLSVALHEALFRCPVSFGRDANKMNFSTVSVPVASADALVARRAREFLALQKDDAGAVSDLEAAVIRAIRVDLRQAPSLRDIAAAVFMTERTLRRRLADGGLAFASILDQQRMHRALQLIRDGRMPLAAVAIETGFADTRSLRRATMRWMGKTATQIKDEPTVAA